MRISTATFHERASAAITAREADVYATQAKIASGRAVSRAADDPVGASLAVRTRADLARTGRWQDAQSAAKTSVSITDATVGSMVDAIASARDTVLAAGNATLNASDRRTLAQVLRGGLEQLVGLANTTDGDGTYLFAGFDNRQAPFAQAGTAVSYGGDPGTREIEVGPGAHVTVARGGDELFMRIPSGNGVFATAGVATNTGTGVIGVGRVTTATSLTGHAYEVRFTAADKYDVVDTTSGTTVSTDNAFTAGGTVAFDGLAFEISGSPAAGDEFAVSPSASSSLFERVARAIAVLEDPATGAAATAWRTGELGGVLQGLDGALDRLIEIRGAAGDALARLEKLTVVAEDRALAQNTQLAAIEDLDYAKEATTLASRNMALEAALAAYSQTGKRSLFDYL